MVLILEASKNPDFTHSPKPNSQTLDVQASMMYSNKATL